MSQQTTIRKLAALVNTPVEKLLEQLSEAGMAFTGPDQVVTSTEKVKLLGFLRRTHGKADKPAEEEVAPKKITLNRTRKQELTVGGGKNRSTVDVVVRRKVTLVKPANETANADGTPGVDDEQAEILRKLEESRQRNLSEQQRLAEEDKRRADEAAERKRQQEAEAERVRKEAEQATAAPATFAVMPPSNTTSIAITAEAVVPPTARDRYPPRFSESRRFQRNSAGRSISWYIWTSSTRSNEASGVCGSLGWPSFTATLSSRSRCTRWPSACKVAGMMSCASTRPVRPTIGERRTV
jgi:translation initiation factor IF-2